MAEDAEISKLGKALLELKATLENQFEQILLLGKITEQINAGQTLDEILNLI